MQRFSLAAAMALLAAASAVRADPVLLYDFGDGDGAADLLPTVKAAHTDATALDMRTGSPTVFNHEAAPLTGGVIFANDWTASRNTTNAFTFDLVIDDGWELALDGWSVSIWTFAIGAEFEMWVETLGPGGTIASSAQWGGFTIPNNNAASSDDLILSPLDGRVLPGHHTYRFSLLGLMDASKSTFLDNVALIGQLREATPMPEPGVAAMLGVGAVWIGVRGCRGRSPGRPCA